MTKKNYSYIFFVLFLGILFSLFSFLSFRKYNDRLPLLDGNHLLDMHILSKGDYDRASKILLEKKTFLSSNFPEHYDTSSNTQWGAVYSNTYRLYIQSLYDVLYLSVLYKNNKDQRYIDEASRLLNGWIDYSETEESKSNEFLWYDHSVSYRAINIVYYIYSSKENNLLSKDFEAKLNDLLYIHGDWLYETDNYSDGNHGLMMDSALLQLSLYFNNKEWFERSVKRINQRVIRDYSSEGVHLENSPEYHVMVTGYYYKILNFLKHHKLDNALTENTKDVIDKMPFYLLGITLPTGYLPTIGDTEAKKVYNPYANEYLEYLVSNGERGKKPKEGLYFFDDAGIVTYRGSFEKEQMADSIWWSFKCGTKNRMHRQDDDLSFMLFANGQEIFSDSGKYSYEEEDLFRKFVVSPQGHTTVSVLNKAYYARHNFTPVKCLELVDSNNKYIWLRGINRGYNSETVIKRDLIYIHQGIFILVDRMNSNISKTYSQQYVLSENVKISYYDTSGFVVKDASQKDILLLAQNIPVQGFTYFHADPTSGKGYISKKFTEKIPADYIEFTQQGVSSTFLTTIVLPSMIGGDKVRSELLGNVLSVYVNDNIIVTGPIDFK